MKFIITITQFLALFAIGAIALPASDAEQEAVEKRDDADSTVDAQFFWRKTKTVTITKTHHPVTVTRTKTRDPETITITDDPKTVHTTVHHPNPTKDHEKDRDEHYKRDADESVDAQFFWPKKTVTVTTTEAPSTKTIVTKVRDGTVTKKVPGRTVTQTVTKDRKW